MPRESADAKNLKKRVIELQDLAAKARQQGIGPATGRAAAERGKVDPGVMGNMQTEFKPPKPMKIIKGEAAKHTIGQIGPKEQFLKPAKR
jgi:hypothetical protein